MTLEAGAAPRQSKVDDRQDAEEQWQASPFSNLSIGKITNLRDFADRDAFKQAFTGELELGRILASAIHFGALLNRDHWGPWLRSIGRMTWWDNLHWIPFKTQVPGERPQRWFADPFTAHLIKNWKKTERASIIADADDVLAAFLAKAYGGRISPDAFYARARLRWHMRLPAVLVDKALGRLPTVPLSEVRWRKLIGHPRFPLQSEKSAFDTFAPREMHGIKKKWVRRLKDFWPDEHLIFETSVKHYRWGSLKYSTWKNLTSAWLKGIADKRRQDLPSWDYRILIPSWLAHRLIETREDEKRGYSPEMMRERLAAISALLGGSWNAVAIDNDLQGKSLTAKVLDKIYGSLSTNNEFARILYAEAVADLRSYIKDRESKIPPPDYSNTKVSASIIPPRVYQKCVSSALTSAPPDWHLGRPFPPSRLELTVATILAFRAGLRMREILGLRVGDFIVSDAILELHLDENDRRPLKTRKSRRLLPLDVLLRASEKALLLMWLDQRRVLAGVLEKNCNCFGPPSHRGVIDSEPYFQAFEKLFERAKEPFLAFRHFRHSFSSYLLTNLTLPERTERCVPAQFRSEINGGRRYELSRRFLGEERIGQSALHAVSQSMGHTGIYRTLESYQHLLDFTLGLYVNDPSVMDTDERELLRLSELVYRRQVESARSLLTNAEPGSYQTPSKTRYKLSDRPAVLKKTRNEYAAEKTERDLKTELLEYDDEVMQASMNRSPEMIDWTVMRHVMKTQDEASLGEIMAAFQISNEDAKYWRDFDGRWSRQWSGPKGPKQYTPDYFGAEGRFYLNRLWTGYRHHPPSELVKEAIGNFVAGFDSGNGGAKLGTIERCLALEDYLLLIGLRPEDFDYQNKAFDLAPWKRSAPLHCRFKFGRPRTVCIRDGNPRLRLRKGIEHDATGYSSDISRASQADDEGGYKASKSGKKPDHRHVTSAMNFFLYLVAAKEKIKPSRLHAKSNDWKDCRDFEIKGERQKRIVWKAPNPTSVVVQL